jgi:hypothetical protein
MTLTFNDGTGVWYHYVPSLLVKCEKERKKYENNCELILKQHRWAPLRLNAVQIRQYSRILNTSCFFSSSTRYMFQYFYFEVLYCLIQKSFNPLILRKTPL